MPASPVTSANAFFVPDSQTGGGSTTITWTDVSSEEDNESYAIFSSGEPFNKTTQFGATQIGLVGEGISEFEYQVPIGRLGPLIIV